MYIVADVESSGLSPQYHRIVSVAASCAGETFSELVNPGQPIPAAATAIHGIRNEDVRGAPTWNDVGRRFWAWVRERAIHNDGRIVLVAHNCAFDTRMIRAECERHAIEVPEFTAVDTLKIAKSVLPNLANFKQCTVYEHLFGRAPDGQHTSLGDVKALAEVCAHEIFRKFVEHPELIASLPKPKRAPRTIVRAVAPVSHVDDAVTCEEPIPPIPIGDPPPAQRPGRRDIAAIEQFRFSG